MNVEEVIEQLELILDRFVRAADRMDSELLVSTYEDLKILDGMALPDCAYEWIAEIADGLHRIQDGCIGTPRSHTVREMKVLRERMMRPMMRSLSN